MLKIKRSKEVLIADFKGSKVIFNLETYIPHTLNSTASLIWDFLKRPKEINQIAHLLKKSYNLDKDKAKKDAGIFIKELKKRGLVCRQRQK
jgi:hypothetical protein